MTQTPSSVFIDVHNTETSILGAPEWLLNMIDKETSYLDPTYTGLKDPDKEFNTVDTANAWNGVHHFLRRPKTKPPWLPSGLRDIVEYCCKKTSTPYQIRDLRKPPEVDVPYYFTPIPLWKHQKEMVEAMIDNPDGVVVAPPRAGKTRAGLEAVRQLAHPTIWIAPTNSIVTQTVNVGQGFFNEQDVIRVQSANQKEARSALLCVCTMQGFMNLSDEFLETRQHLMVDEIHHVLANNAWGSALRKKTKHIYWRHGMTGTHFRSNDDELAMHAFISRQVYEVSTRELLARGFLVPTYVCFMQYNGKKLRGAGQDWHCPKGAQNKGVGTMGLYRNHNRNEMFAWAASVLAKANKHVLVIVGTKEQGYAIKNLIKNQLPTATSMHHEFERVEFVSTDRSKKKIQRILDSFRDRQEVQILIGTSMIGEGVDLPNADALCWARGEKAAVTLTQGLFRVCTKEEGKHYSIVVDAYDLHHKTLQNHSESRWNLCQAEPTFSLSLLESPEEFLTFVGQ